MADISSIKLPDGNSYNLKDKVALKNSATTYVTNKADLNTVDYLILGQYASSSASNTFTNSALQGAWHMIVMSPLSIENPPLTKAQLQSSTQVRRLRYQLNYSTGEIYAQSVVGGDTAGQYSYGKWQKIAMVSDIPSSLPANGGTASNVSGTVAINHGGTGATDANAARTNLGLGNLATKSTNASTTQFLRGDGTWAAPAYPSVSDSTITIKQTGKPDQSFTLNGGAATISLNDNNTTALNSMSGTLTVNHGGTGQVGFTPGALLMGNGANPIVTSSPVGSSTQPIYISSSGRPFPANGEATQEDIEEMLGNIHGGSLATLDNSTKGFSILDIAHGGTGASTATDALSNLGGSPKGHTHTPSQVGITIGTAAAPATGTPGSIYIQML